MEQEFLMSFRILTTLLLIILLAGCNIRENSNLPSGVSPFELLDDVVYLKDVGLYETSHPDIYLKVTKENPQGFDFIEDSYDFSTTSHSYFIKLVDEAGDDIASTSFLPLVAIPSQQFSYLGLKHQGDYSRFYPYPGTSKIDGFGAYYQAGYCYFILSDSGYYQTVSDANPHTSVTVEIAANQTDDLNVSLYQAQFILPYNLIPPGVQRIKLDRIEADNLAEYNLNLSDLPVSFNLIQNNPEAERYPLLYLPLPPETDMTAISVTQLLPNQQELVFHFTESLESLDQFTIYGNCVLVLVNNQGKFIINEL